MINEQTVESKRGGGRANIKDFSFIRNRNLKVNPFPRQIVYSYDLADDAVFMVDGKKVEMAMNQLPTSGMVWQMGDSVVLSNDSDLGSKINLVNLTTTLKDQESEVLANNVIITITFSGPPLKITIT